MVPGRFLVTFGHMNTLQKELNCFLVGKSRTWPPLILTAPFITKKKNCSVYKVHGTQNDRLELTVSTQKKICTGSWDIGHNVPKSRLPNQTCIFWDVLANISGPIAYFSKPILGFKPWAQAGRFEYHKPYKRNNFFFSYKGGWQY